MCVKNALKTFFRPFIKLLCRLSVLLYIFYIFYRVLKVFFGVWRKVFLIITKFMTMEGLRLLPLFSYTIPEQTERLKNH